MWQVKTFNELDVATLFQIYKLRTAVFVVAQERIYQEVDEADRQAVHVYQQDANGQILAYARIFRENGHVTFGRVVVAEAARGTGLGQQLVEEILRVIGERFPGEPIEIEAQEQVEHFYERTGFVSVGDKFLFNHTPHIRMQHEPISA